MAERDALPRLSTLEPGRARLLAEHSRAAGGFISGSGGGARFANVDTPEGGEVELVDDALRDFLWALKDLYAQELGDVRRALERHGVRGVDLPLADRVDLLVGRLRHG